jgi:hypothetical protein
MTNAVNKNWEWNPAPFYLWEIAWKGNRTPRSNSIGIKVNFDQILDNLYAAFIANFQGIYRNNWGDLYSTTITQHF